MQDDCFCDEEAKKEVRFFNRTSFSSLSARKTGSVQRRPRNLCTPLRKHFSKERLSKTRLKSSRTAAETFWSAAAPLPAYAPLERVADTGINSRRRGIVILMAQRRILIHTVLIVGSNGINIRAAAQVVGVAHRGAVAGKFRFAESITAVRICSVRVADGEQSLAAQHRSIHAGQNAVAFKRLAAEIADA